MTTPASTSFLPVIRRVVLRTNDAGRLTAFYQQTLGLVPRRDSPRRQDLSLLHPGSGEVLVTLIEEPAAQPPPRGAPGLFHIAFLYPNLADWRGAVRRVVQLTPGLQGAADHGVSWAVYLADPDGNGIELAWDKPACEWPWRGERIEMVSLPLPLNSILLNESGQATGHGTFHIGHLHLQVADLSVAADFCRRLDLRVTQSDYPGARFMARGSYHHHLPRNSIGSTSLLYRRIRGRMVCRMPALPV
jgi:catechol 2,3-dioxygenase